jgi:CHAT domain-containing protein
LAETPGQPPLPAVHEELAALAKRLPPPGAARHLVGEQATRSRVLAEIAEHPWLHLACHAAQHDTDPSTSGFALWDGPLTIADLAGVRVPDAELAYLSACQTATGTALLADESVHLAAAMLLLGYRHVVATLWSVHDATAPVIADAFYAALPTHRDVSPLPAAQALHDAVARLRARRPADPLLWAPYLHIGA